MQRECRSNRKNKGGTRNKNQGEKHWKINLNEWRRYGIQNWATLGKGECCQLPLLPFLTAFSFLKVKTEEKKTSHDLKGNSQVPHAHPLNDFVTSESCVPDA